jgi:hypothetical protein
VNTRPGSHEPPHCCALAVLRTGSAAHWQCCALAVLRTGSAAHWQCCALALLRFAFAGGRRAAARGGLCCASELGAARLGASSDPRVTILSLNCTRARMKLRWPAVLVGRASSRQKRAGDPQLGLELVGVGPNPRTAPAELALHTPARATPSLATGSVPLSTSADARTVCKRQRAAVALCHCCGSLHAGTR